MGRNRLGPILGCLEFPDWSEFGDVSSFAVLVRVCFFCASPDYSEKVLLFLAAGRTQIFNIIQPNVKYKTQLTQCVCRVAELVAELWIFPSDGGIDESRFIPPTWIFNHEVCIVHVKLEAFFLSYPCFVHPVNLQECILD